MHPIAKVMQRSPGDPSNRLPWLALAAGILIILIAVGVFIFNRRTSTVAINEASPVPRAASEVASPPPTLVPPTLPTSAVIASPPPTPTRVPVATPSPAPTPSQPPPTVAVVTPPSPAAAPQPTAAAPASPVAAATTAATPTQAAPTPAQPPSPTPFSGQVANSGGVGNTRSDLDAAYGTPLGETPEHLVVYRKGTFEYHVQLVPDINGRAALIAQLPQQGAQPLTLEAAQAEARKLLPTDAQPANPTPEGNADFVVQRFSSNLLGQALPSTANQGGQLMAVYARDSAGRITRLVVGAGNDPQALLNAGR